jgi:hypothetical protein
VAHALRLAMDGRRQNTVSPVEDRILPSRPDVWPGREVAAAALIAIGAALSVFALWPRGRRS